MNAHLALNYYPNFVVRGVFHTIKMDLYHGTGHWDDISDPLGENRRTFGIQFWEDLTHTEGYCLPTAGLVAHLRASIPPDISQLHGYRGYYGTKFL